MRSPVSASPPEALGLSAPGRTPKRAVLKQCAPLGGLTECFMTRKPEALRLFAGFFDKFDAFCISRGDNWRWGRDNRGRAVMHCAQWRSVSLCLRTRPNQRAYLALPAVIWEKAGGGESSRDDIQQQLRAHTSHPSTRMHSTGLKRCWKASQATSGACRHVAAQGSWTRCSVSKFGGSEAKTNFVFLKSASNCLPLR